MDHFVGLVGCERINEILARFAMLLHWAPGESKGNGHQSAVSVAQINAINYITHSPNHHTGPETRVLTLSRTALGSSGGYREGETNTLAPTIRASECVIQSERFSIILSPFWGCPMDPVCLVIWSHSLTHTCKQASKSEWTIYDPFPDWCRRIEAKIGFHGNGRARVMGFNHFSTSLLGRTSFGKLINLWWIPVGKKVLV